jgi:hypothetical protein
MSGELARAWHEQFSDEVLAGIAHHDDGWRDWEAEPQLDPQSGRPLSFLEMPIADSLAIWNGSIAAARSIGPLAGAIVAGHFIELARGSEQATSPLAQTWLRDMADQRAAWLDEWQRAAPANSLAVAERGQRMLLVADLLSLWLCCDGPVTSMEADPLPNAEMKTRTAAVLGKYHFTTHDKSVRNDQIAWQGTIAPWPLVVEELSLAAPALAAPVGRYPSWPALAAASRPVGLRWRLRQTLPDRAEC